MTIEDLAKVFNTAIEEFWGSGETWEECSDNSKQGCLYCARAVADKLDLHLDDYSPSSIEIKGGFYTTAEIQEILNQHEAGE